MYIYEALSHVTPHSMCRTLITACYIGNGGERGGVGGWGWGSNLGAIISYHSCCSELVGVQYNEYTTTTNLRSNTNMLSLMCGPKTMLYILRSMFSGVLWPLV